MEHASSNSRGSPKTILSDSALALKYIRRICMWREFPVFFATYALSCDWLTGVLLLAEETIVGHGDYCWLEVEVPIRNIDRKIKDTAQIQNASRLDKKAPR